MFRELCAQGDVEDGVMPAVWGARWSCVMWGWVGRSWCVLGRARAGRGVGVL